MVFKSAIKGMNRMPLSGSGSRNRAHLARRSFFSRSRDAILAKSKNIIDAIWISVLSCARTAATSRWISLYWSRTTIIIQTVKCECQSFLEKLLRSQNVQSAYIYALLMQTLWKYIYHCTKKHDSLNPFASKCIAIKSWTAVPKFA